MPKIAPREPLETDERAPRSRTEALSRLLGRLVPLDLSALKTDERASGGGGEMTPLECRSYEELIEAWKSALHWIDGLDVALSVMLSSIVSTKFVGDQLWVKILSPPSTGKSRLCEAVSIARKHVLPKSTLRGFHSGFGDGKEDNSLVGKANGMTLVTKDGDTLLQSPNLGQILSEGRDVYDGCSRTSYRNKASKDHEGLRLTWILAGTSSLKAIDQSELGERFLDCVIMEEIDNDLEDMILLRTADQADRDLNMESNGSPNSQQSPEMTKAYRLTGGYIEYLKEISTSTLGTLYFPDEKKIKCAKLGKFVAFLRARPSVRQDEKAEREMGARLVSTHVRLAKCLAMVMNKEEIDDECMRRTRKVAMDTASGPTMKIVDHLYRAPHGLEIRALELFTNVENSKLGTLLRFLKEIGVTKRLQNKQTRQFRWHLTPLMRKLYEQVEED